MKQVMERLKHVDWNWTGRPIKINEYKPLSSGVDGYVYEINTNKRYVVKIMTNRDAYDMEKYVGSKAGIERSGVRVHGYYASKLYYALILDHASFGNRDVAFTMPAKEYLVNNNNTQSSLLEFDRMFGRKLRVFYNTVQGFHGDLHDQNVVVTLDKHKNLLNIVILDYGRFVPFDHRSGVFRATNDLRTMLNKGHREFKNVTYNQHFTYLNVPRRAYKKTGTRNPSASNRNMLQSERYWKRAYNRLVKQNYLIRNDVCTNRTVVELKQMLRNQNLKMTGKKEELCARLSLLDNNNRSRSINSFF